MDSETNEQDSIYSKASREEIEEALRWLEDLSNKNLVPVDDQTNLPQSDHRTTDPANSPEGRVTELPSDIESPFYGILDTSEEDLPEWLREISTTSTMAMLEGGEMESRLDWLAKMARRESIEELPTLEWRRISSPLHEMRRSIEEVPPITDHEKQLIGELTAPAESSETDAIPVAEHLAFFSDTEGTVEGESTIPEAIDTKSFDDLDAAMAWIEELAASQEAPIEDLPSVADRALASKLMMEAGLLPDGDTSAPLPAALSQLDELEPPASYHSDEDPADTVVLMETIAAESGRVIVEPETELDELRAPVAEDNLPEELVDADIELAEVLPELATMNLGESGNVEGEPGFQEVTFHDERTSSIESVAAAKILTSEALDADSEEIPGEVPAMSFEEAIAYLEGIAQGKAEPELQLEFDNELSGESIGEEIEEVSEEVLGSSSEVDALQMIPEATTQEINELLIEEALVQESTADMEGFNEEIIEEAPIEASTADVEDFSKEIEDGSLTADIAIAYSLDRNGTGQYPLDVKLVAIDALALPTGRRIEEIDASLGSFQPARQLSSDLLSAIDWLETTLQDTASLIETTPTELADEDLIQMMPEDPDEALAWLVRLANDDLEDTRLHQTGASPAGLDGYEVFEVSSGISSQPASEIKANEIEADLMAMPEDPDEAMAWLESFADMDIQTGESIRPVETPEVAYGEQASNAPTIPEPVVETALPIPESPRRPTRKRGVGASWVDLLKPLEK